MKESNQILIIHHTQDDQPIEGGMRGWVSHFDKFFRTLLSQINRFDPEIKLVSTADLTAAELEKSLCIMVIVSPALMADNQGVDLINKWAADLHGKNKLEVSGVSRFLKIMKSPEDADVAFPDFSAFANYDFFFVDGHTGKKEEFKRFFGADAEKSFWMKLVDTAYDISLLVDQSSVGSEIKSHVKDRNKVVYLASTGMDLLIQRDVIKRELKRHGYEVLPSKSLPKNAQELEKSIREDLATARMSIHMVGEDYGYRLEGSDKSVVDIQNSIAHEHTLELSAYNKQNNNDKPFSRLVWLSPELKNMSERQKIFIEDIKGGAAAVEEAEVLQIQLQELKSIIREELVTGGRFHVKREVKGYKEEKGDGSKLVYLITDKVDIEASSQIKDSLTKQGFKVLTSNFEGDLADVRYVHQQNLKRCDGTIIYYGGANYEWIKTKQSDLLKAPAFGREKPLRAKALFIDGKKEIDTSNFEKNKTLVLGNSDSYKSEDLAPFITKLKD